MQNNNNKKLIEWVEHWKKILQPECIYWCNGSQEEYNTLCQQLVVSGTFKKLNEQLRPNSYVANSDPKDVARVEECTFICSKNCIDAGPTNNWHDPEAMRKKLHLLYNGAMKGRTMYIVPFSMGPLNSNMSHIGIQITDSAYVVVNMKIMTRMGKRVLNVIENEDKEWIPCIHSVGAPLLDKTTDVPWPCNNENKYIVHFPETREIWSFGSGYGGNALLGKKCFALRIASVIGRDNDWLAEHMLILKLTNQEGGVKYIVAAFPSACGKTNLAMMVPSIPGWKVETIGDDICWMKFGADGKMYAINPESGFFGVATGTGWNTNANAMHTLHANCIFTNTATMAEGDVWWEGMTDAAPDMITDWQNQNWTPNDAKHHDKRSPAAHPNSRFTAPASQCPCIAPEWDDPNGVPVSAIIFGGRRSTTMPLVAEAFDWEHGVFLGSVMASETTAAAGGAIGKLRFDPMAMLPFCGYNMADYFHHWLKMGQKTNKNNLPKIFIVNWFRRNEHGNFIWPGFSENSRVLKWISERIDGKLSANETPIGHLPHIDDLDVASLIVSKDDIQSILDVDVNCWREYIIQIKDFYSKFQDRLPVILQKILNQLEEKINDVTYTNRK
jgi:phosphoenolpyruvate carboxykinase (GTP)